MRITRKEVSHALDILIRDAVKIGIDYSGFSVVRNYNFYRIENDGRSMLSRKGLTLRELAAAIEAAHQVIITVMIKQESETTKNKGERIK